MMLRRDEGPAPLRAGVVGLLVGMLPSALMVLTAMWLFPFVLTARAVVSQWVGA